jgi:septation ring formation regulator EzrA
LKALNSDEVHAKLMKIFEEREELYRQMENEVDHSNRLSISSKGPKNQSMGPIIRSQHMLSES